MLVYKNGDILQAGENIICHQVNEDGIMGGGLALQIANKYSHVEGKYIELCKCYGNKIERLLNKYQTIKIDEHKYIANCFTQNNFATDLLAIDLCFSKLLIECHNKRLSIAIPYKYGCGIAKGNWNEVEKIFKKLSDEYNVDIYVYKYE